MRSPKLLMCALGAFLVVAPAASAQNSTVTALATSDLALSVPATVVTAGTLTAGQTTNFTPSAVVVTAPTATGATPWTLKVKDATNAGQLQKTNNAACISASAAAITSPLSFGTATANQASGSGLGGLAGSVGSSDVNVARGTTLADTVNTTYSVAVPSGTQLAAGCPYSTTLTYTLSVGA